MGSFVLLSGSGERDDKIVANIVTSELGPSRIDYQFLPWAGRDGRELPRDVKVLIMECAAFVPIVSTHSVATERLFSQVQEAIDHDKLIFPLKVGNCTFGGNLRFMQYEWFYQAPSAVWLDRLRAVCAPDALAPQKVIRAHEDAIWGLTYNNKTRFFSTGSWDRSVRIWTDAPNVDTRVHEGRNFLPQPSRVLAVAYAPDGNELAIGREDGTIRVWHPLQHRELALLSGHSDAVRALAYSSDGNTLFSASVDATVVRWERRDEGFEARPLSREHALNVLGLACAPDDATFATVSEDRTVRVWNNPPTAKPRWVLNGHTSTVWSVAYSPTAEHLASAGKDRTARIWDLRSGDQIGRLDGHTSSVIAVAYSVNGRFLATGSADETIRIWEAATGSHVATLTGHADAVRAVAFAPDGLRLTSASADGTVMHWPLPAEVQ